MQRIKIIDFMSKMAVAIKKEGPYSLDQYKKFTGEVLDLLNHPRVPKTGVEYIDNIWYLLISENASVETQIELAVYNLLEAINTNTIDQFAFDFINF